MVRRSADDRETGGDVDARVHCQELEGDQPLIVVHSEYAVKSAVRPTPPEPVRCHRTEDQYPSLPRLLYRWSNHVWLLTPDETILPRMRIESHHD